MNTEKILALVLQDLGSDYLKMEMELERVINSDIKTTDKLQTIKSILYELTAIENSINKFKNLVSNNIKNEEINE